MYITTEVRLKGIYVQHSFTMNDCFVKLIIKKTSIAHNMNPTQLLGPISNQKTYY